MRANRHCFREKGLIFHITHRCHDKSFLFKLQSDRNSWKNWLFKACKRYELCVLNYVVTRNHIHLLVKNNEKNNSVARAMQLVSGRIGQEYNLKKNRKGAFWEDRYHVTIIENDMHFLQCFLYIDFNMVRAGVVKNPIQWRQSGFYELHTAIKYKRIIDVQELLKIAKVDSLKNFRKLHLDLTQVKQENVFLQRDEKWSKSIVVGSKDFVGKFSGKYARGYCRRKIYSENDTHYLK